MRVSAKADYAVRAALALADATSDEPLSGERIAEAQGIPLPFLSNILDELAHHGLVEGGHGADAGFWLSAPAAEITMAEVIDAVDGPLASVRGEQPDRLRYPPAAEPLRQVWVALADNVRAVLDHVTVADLASGRLPEANVPQ